MKRLQVYDIPNINGYYFTVRRNPNSDKYWDNITVTLQPITEGRVLEETTSINQDCWQREIRRVCNQLIDRLEYLEALDIMKEEALLNISEKGLRVRRERSITGRQVER